uniref:Endonuclease/exonuclease/phosphatase domain-containing protein n=1 Tax=Latimeria chalumnae TaxID=7897 RepID=H3AIW2_LATCH
MVTWNVNGVNSPIKRYKILSHLSKMQCDVSFLQETYLVPSEVLKLRTRWVGRVYSSSFSSKRNGVCILISKKTPFVELETESGEEGRFVIVRGLLRGVEVVLISVYALVQNPIPFYVKLGTILSKYKGKNIIAGGDWNGVLDSSLDKSSAPTPSDLNITRGLRELCREMGLIDSWRAVHGTKKDYTFFSRVHSSYSRLDTFLTSHLVALGTTEVNIHNRILSDHAPVSMEFLLEPQMFRRIIWRFNNSLLKDKAFVASLKTEIASFFQLNEESIDSVQLLWDAFKATLRGWLISHTSYRKKHYQKQWKELEKIVNDLEQLHKASPKDVMIAGELKKAHLDLQEFIHKKTEYALYKTKKKYFEAGDKAGRHLAHRLKVLENVNMVSEIRDNSNKIIKNPTEITQEFLSFYKELYTSQGNITPDSIDNFLNQRSLPVLEEGRSLLENRISEQEVKQAIKDLTSGKAPGCD